MRARSRASAEGGGVDPAFAQGAEGRGGWGSIRLIYAAKISGIGRIAKTRGNGTRRRVVLGQ